MERFVFPATPRSPSSSGRVWAGVLVGLTALLTAVVAPDAGAARVSALRAPVANVSTDPAGAHVRLSRGGAWVEVRAPRAGGGEGGGAPTSGCLRRWVPTRYPIYLRNSPVKPDRQVVPMPPSPGPGYVAYHVWCGPTYVTSVWLPPAAFLAAAPIDPRVIAEELVRDLPYPAATVGASPDARGLTGLESWFWVVGYRGPLRDAVNELGVLVEVEATPASVQWDFGDGTAPVAGTLGRAAPRRSDVAHVYERRRRSVPAAVRAVVRLDVRYRVDGGPWLPLDPVFRTATRAYPVAESRAALVPAA
jgi:hypothetical protein